jgi:nucleoid DNA-binding protein
MAKDKKPLTQAQFVDEVVENLKNRYDKNDVKRVLKAVAFIVAREAKKGAGKCVVPELSVQVSMVRKPATKARKGRNPATGEEITIPAKKAHNVVKTRPMKKLKDMIL